MSKTEALDLDEFVDGIITSKTPGAAGCVTFVNTIPHSEVACESGFIIRFAGPQFTHDNPRVIEVLRRLSRRGVGISELIPQAVEVAEKPVDSVLKEGAKIDTTVKAGA